MMPAKDATCDAGHAAAEAERLPDEDRVLCPEHWAGEMRRRRREGKPLVPYPGRARGPC